MKLMKKITTLLLCVCLVVAGLSFTSFAAVDGRISFNDPTVEAGKEVVVTVTTKVDAGVSNLKFTLKYDPSMLEFVSAPNMTKMEDGKLEYDYAINQNSMLRGYGVGVTFRALSEGTTRIDMTSYDIGSSFDIKWTVGYSQVTISAGDTSSEEPTDNPLEEPADDPTEEPTDDPVEEPTDDPAEEPTDDPVDEPTEDSFDNSTEDSAQIDISSSTTITLIGDVTGIELPAQYIATTVAMDGVEYPAWQDSENPGMYILYAQNHLGNRSLYRYDNFENTYQRFAIPKVEKQEQANVLSVLGDKVDYVVWGAAVLLLLLIIIVIVLGVKLYNRDAELDEVYDDLDAALAEKEAMRKNGYMKVETPEVVPEIVPEVLPEVVTVDDVVLETEEEDDPEGEVEFYTEEEDDPEVEVEFYTEEEDDSEVEVEFYQEEPEMKEVLVEEEPTKEEFLDDDDDEYSGLPGEFFVDFIDLDD